MNPTHFLATVATTNVQLAHWHTQNQLNLVRYASGVMVRKALLEDPSPEKVT